MISELEAVLMDLQDMWACSEDPTTISFSSADLSVSDRERIFEQVNDLRSIIDGRSLVFKIVEEREIFEYRIHWEPNNNITLTTDSDQGTDGNDVFQDDATISAIETLRNGRIREIDDLRECLEGFIENENVAVSFVYRVDSTDISSIIENELDGVHSVRFYFQKSTFLNHIDTDELRLLRNLLLPTLDKQMFAIQDLDAPCYGRDLGFFSLSDLPSNSYDDFTQLRSNLNEMIASVGRECVIDEFEDIYIPPDFFEFQAVNDDSFVTDLLSYTSGYRLLYCIFSLSNVVRRRSDSWQVRINGKKILEEKIRIEKSGEEWKLKALRSESVASEVPVTQDLVNSFVDVFQWSYEYKVRVTDRVSVLRNIITLYTTSIEGLINNIDEIHDSTKSNFKFYAEESVDEFIGMQQEVSNYLLETQREFSELRRNLANSLSRDLFRVFGFLVVTWVGIFLQLERIATVRNALSISLVPVIFYLALSIRAVHGLSQQFSSLEESRDAYYRMYKRQMNEELFEEIVDSSEEERISGQFQTDKRIYYALFGGLLLLAAYAIIDLQVLHGLVSDIVRSILSDTN